MHFFVNPTKQWQSDFVQYFLMYESSKTQTYAKMIIEIFFEQAFSQQGKHLYANDPEEG